MESYYLQYRTHGIVLLNYRAGGPWYSARVNIQFTEDSNLNRNFFSDDRISKKEFFRLTRSDRM
ncbi:hypothetical protein LEP1GSC178_1608 [Leptospira licerasiae str. MMD4847]|uniref:Uncharacterized protein n=1 Tax=Leptospira licerasiae str. MMD4847 TaxID=1049971 RepID=A0ABN0H5K8_9LEPT|nr:hypothetical protein LEP1GSC178_1608 [Leptospira licerasiae str. MMD4847]